ncbi:HD domain-containing protein [Nocardia vaccinii]|uniref:HD domain-containing protein n=1 Tax=Nocardia vaccinii TaxID=1822 RepID=UPI00082F51B2|nr:HD domain-containing protein [Nocardia vaccinii]
MNSNGERADQAADATVTLAYEMGFLKALPRSGWLRAGIPSPESVAAHSWRVAVLAFVIALGEGADAHRAAVLGLFHDLPETRSGDVAAAGKSYVSIVPAVEIAADQTAELPDELAEQIRAAVAEHEGAKTAGATLEARCSRDADKLELLLQAREYAHAGQGVGSMPRYIESMVPLITTTTGKALRDAALRVSPAAWWDDFARRFGGPEQGQRPIRIAK